MVLTRGLAALVAATVLAAGSAAAQPAAATTAAPRTVSAPAGDIEARRKVLLAQMLADPGNLDIAFEYAALSSQVGDLEGAVSTLERMLIFAPGLPRLQLELGVLYYRLGAYEPALAYFNGALAAPDVPPEVRDKVEQYIAAIEKRSETSGVGGAIMFGARYQTNANSAPANPRVMINGFPFTLGADSVSAPDTNAFIAGTFRAVQDLENQGDRLVATAQVYGALYREQGRLNTGIVEINVGPSFNLQNIGIEDARFDIYAIASGMMLGSDPYLLSGGLGARLEKTLGGTRLGLESELVFDDYQNSATRPRAGDSDGSRLNGAASLQQRVNDNLLLFGSLSVERRTAQRAYLATLQGTLTVGGTVTFGSLFGEEAGDWSLTVSGGVAKRVYDAPDPIINPTTAQVDEEAFAQAALSVPLKDGWSVETNASYRNVMSNYDLSDSENYTVSLAGMKKF